MNEDLIKQEFVRENIERDIRAIFEAQYLIATERVYTSAIYPTQVGQGRSLVREQGYGRLVRGTTGRLLSAFLCIGYIAVAVDRQHRGFHDMLCDTRVVYDI